MAALLSCLLVHCLLALLIDCETQSSNVTKPLQYSSSPEINSIWPALTNVGDVLTFNEHINYLIQTVDAGDVNVENLEPTLLSKLAKLSDQSGQIDSIDGDQSESFYLEQFDSKSQGTKIPNLSASGPSKSDLELLPALANKFATSALKEQLLDVSPAEDVASDSAKPASSFVINGSLTFESPSVDLNPPNPPNPPPVKPAHSKPLSFVTPRPASNNQSTRTNNPKPSTSAVPTRASVKPSTTTTTASAPAVSFSQLSHLAPSGDTSFASDGLPHVRKDVFTPKDCGRSFDIDLLEDAIDRFTTFNSDSGFSSQLSPNSKLKEELSTSLETNLLHFSPNSSDAGRRSSLLSMLKNREEIVYSNEKRIINGQRANPGQFPWQVSIQAYLPMPQNPKKFYWRHICGGSIVNSHWVLTAAHCLELRRLQRLTGTRGPPQLSVMAGSLSWNNSEQVGWRHPIVEQRKYYQPFTAFGQYLQLVFDIALVRVRGPFQFGSGIRGVGAIERICLPSLGNSKINEDLRISGWGSITQYPSLMIPLYLRTVDLPSVSDTECELRYWPLRSRRYFLCAGYLEEYMLRGVCMGDSGSPLIQRGEDGRSVQVGIVSGGRLPCGSGSFPGTYARISAFRQWIKSVTTT